MGTRAIRKPEEKTSPLALALFVVLMCSLFIVGVALGDIHSTHQVGIRSRTVRAQSKLQAALIGVVKEYETHGLSTACDFARRHGIGLSGNKVEVVLVVDHKSGVGCYLSARHGVEVLAIYRDLWSVAVPISDLASLAYEEEAISWIRPPFKPLPCVVSEGVGLTKADEWHAHGFTGQGVKVAVIDVGFYGLSAAIAAGELPADVDTVDYSGNGVESASSHGVAVAEIVHDIAPGAHLTMINIANEVDLGNAKDYCIANDIDIINHSVGWANTGGYDGTGLVCDIANDADQNNLLWINAAGNHAQKHYRDSFTDDNEDSLHDFRVDPLRNFNSLGYLSAGAPIWVYLSWSSWPMTDQDYDLFLYGLDGSWGVLDSSCTRQTGSQPPTEEILDFYVPFDGEFAVAVRLHQGAGNQSLTLFSAYQDFEFRTEAGSLLSPADAIGVLSVAAIDKENWTTGPQESSSSQGPTYDERMKPDISGPDRVANWTYGSFGGTSAASPHAAGAAAVLKSAFPVWTLTEVRSCLESNAIDMGEIGQDSLYGWGRLDLPLDLGTTGLPSRDLTFSLSWGLPNPFSTEVGIHYKLPEAGHVTVSVYNPAGERITELLSCVLNPGSHGCVWNGSDSRGRRVGSGVYFLMVETAQATQTKPVLFLR